MCNLEEIVKRQWQEDLRRENEEILDKKKIFLIHYKTKITVCVVSALLISLMITISHILSNTSSSMGILLATWAAFSTVAWAATKRVKIYKQIKKKDPNQMTLDERRFFLQYWWYYKRSI